MKRSDLKKIIKPIVKECILESLIEEGVLSNIISEVMAGTQKSLINEQVNFNNARQQKQTQLNQQKQVQQEHERRQKLEEQRQKVMASINADSFGGSNLFEGTTPIPAEGGPANPLRGIDPSDPGTDISAFFK